MLKQPSLSSRLGRDVTSAHINQLIRRDVPLSDYQIFVIPGGFTYGDDISAGRVLANELKLKLGEDIHGFIDRGGLILGICNGFQVLVKAGFLPGGDARGQAITLSTNDSGRFECRWVYLNVNKNSPCLFTEGIDRMYLPVANGEGKVVTGGKALPDLSIVLTYSDESEAATQAILTTPVVPMGISLASVTHQGVSLP